MLEQIRRATEADARAARTRAIRVIAGAIGGIALAVLSAATGSPFGQGFAVAMTIAASVLSTAALVRAAERRNLAARVLAALSTADARGAIEAARSRAERNVGLHRFAQNLGLGFGLIAGIGAAILGGPFFEGIAIGVVLAVFAEQALDHDAEVRAVRYASTLAA